MARDARFRGQLLERRRRLQSAIPRAGEPAALQRLLSEVDSALLRIDAGSYGLCEVCLEAIEPERLISDPLIRTCLDHLTPDQQRALEQDLELAARIQGALLPKRDLRCAGWEVSYHYEAAGPVSGDYCDLVGSGGAEEDLFFLLGDVSGKGVAASMLMAHLHALFRSLIRPGVPPRELVERANRIFCESTMPASFATLVCGRASRSGEVELCNAGHCPPVLIQDGRASPLEATGLPVGIFCSGEYLAQSVRLSRGHTLFLYTDGLSEARDPSGAEYGSARLSRFLAERGALAPRDLIDACLTDSRNFRTGAPRIDDLTMMVLRREA